VNRAVHDNLKLALPRSCLIENIPSLINSSPQLFLFFGRQMDRLLAFNTAATLVFFPAFITLDKKKMTGIVDAVHMRVRGFPTLMTSRSDLFRYSFSEALVKDEILSMKFICQSFFFDLVGIMNDPAFKVKHVFKSFVKHPG
jgi:hypothetical protein